MQQRYAFTVTSPSHLGQLTAQCQMTCSPRRPVQPACTASSAASATPSASGLSRRRRRPQFAALDALLETRALSPAAAAGPADTTADTAPGVLDALRELGLSVEETRRTVKHWPRVLKLDREMQITPTLRYLREQLSLSDKQLKAVVRFAPQVFGFSPETDFPSRIAFLEQNARVPRSLLAAAVARRPHILWMDLPRAGAVVDIIVATCPTIAPDVLGTVFSRVPQALVASPSDIRSNLDFLAGWSLNAAAITRIVAKFPLALVFSKLTMKKRLEYLRYELQLATGVVGKVVVANPDILQWSVEHRIEPAIEDLARIVGRQAVAGVVTKLPGIFGLMYGIPSRVYWLTEVVGLSNTEVGIVVRKAPAILTYSVSANLHPKWSLIHKTMGAKRSDLVEAPREILCANLQQRALPRYAFTVSKLGAAAANIKVTDILCGCDVDYCRNVVHCDPKEYRKFVEEDRYLLFFSQLM